MLLQLNMKVLSEVKVNISQKFYPKKSYSTSNLKSKMCFRKDINYTISSVNNQMFLYFSRCW